MAFLDGADDLSYNIIPRTLGWGRLPRNDSCSDAICLIEIPSAHSFFAFSAPLRATLPARVARRGAENAKDEETIEMINRNMLTRSDNV
jgi:hypothetical protein